MPIKKLLLPPNYKISDIPRDKCLYTMKHGPEETVVAKKVNIKKLCCFYTVLFRSMILGMMECAEDANVMQVNQQRIVQVQ